MIIIKQSNYVSTTNWSSILIFWLDLQYFWCTQTTRKIKKTCSKKKYFVIQFLPLTSNCVQFCKFLCLVILGNITYNYMICKVQSVTNKVQYMCNDQEKKGENTSILSSVVYIILFWLCYSNNFKPCLVIFSSSIFSFPYFRPCLQDVLIVV